MTDNNKIKQAEELIARAQADLENAQRQLEEARNSGTPEGKFRETIRNLREGSVFRTGFEGKSYTVPFFIHWTGVNALGVTSATGSRYNTVDEFIERQLGLGRDYVEIEYEAK